MSCGQVAPVLNLHLSCVLAQRYSMASGKHQWGNICCGCISQCCTTSATSQVVYLFPLTPLAKVHHWFPMIGLSAYKHSTGCPFRSKSWARWDQVAGPKTWSETIWGGPCSNEKQGRQFGRILFAIVPILTVQSGPLSTNSRAKNIYKS